MKHNIKDHTFVAVAYLIVQLIFYCVMVRNNQNNATLPLILVTANGNNEHITYVYHS